MPELNEWEQIRQSCQQEVDRLSDREIEQCFPKLGVIFRLPRNRTATIRDKRSAMVAARTLAQWEERHPGA